MEYNLSKHSVGYCEYFLDTVNEQIVDMDITLPDYCPDIEKILKCTMKTKVYSRNISGGQLTIEGVALVRVLYCDSIRHNVRVYEQTMPFTSTFNLKSTPENYIVLTNTKCEYINCRALSKRKMVIHGAFSLYAKVIRRALTDFYDFEDDSDLQIKKQTLSVSDMCAMCQEYFSLTEDISLDSKPYVDALLSYDTSVYITELKSVHNKLMLSAELELKLMYLSNLENGQIEHSSFVFPINKIFDCDTVLDDTINVPYIEVMSSDLHIRNDNLSDNSLLSLDVKMCFSDINYSSKELNIIEDAYSTKYITEEKRSVLNCESNHTCEDFTYIVKNTVELDSIKISKLLDVYCDSISVTPVISKNSLTLSGKANLCLLIEDDENAPVFLERSVELEYKPDVAYDFDTAHLKLCQVKSISFRLVDECTIDLRIEVNMSAVLCNMISKNPIVSLTADEEKALKQEESPIVLYFADKGESVWDIAKKYSTKPNLLISENELNDDILECEQMLMILT